MDLTEELLTDHEHTEITLAVRRILAPPDEEPEPAPAPAPDETQAELAALRKENRKLRDQLAETEKGKKFEPPTVAKGAQPYQGGPLSGFFRGE